MTAPFEQLNIPRNEDGPVFDEPWQAEAFALTLKLHEQRLFTWPEWADCFGAEIAARTATSGQADNESYYLCWLSALEKMTTAKNLVSPDQLETRKEKWRRAYLNTPHGKPIALSAADNA